MDSITVLALSALITLSCHSVVPVSAIDTSRDAYNLDIPDVTTYSGHLFSMSFRGYPGLSNPNVYITIGEVDPFKPDANSDAVSDKDTTHISSLPSWLRFNNSAKTLEGIPTPDVKGQHILGMSAKCRPETGCSEKQAMFQVNVIDRAWDQPANSLVLKNPGRFQSDGSRSEMEGEGDDAEDLECSEDRVVASLIFCASLKELSTSVKIQLVQNLSRFLSISENAIGIEASSTQSLKAVEFGFQIISAGPGSGDASCSMDENIEMIWQLPCQMVRHLSDFVKVLQHNVDVGRFNGETGFVVVGWYVASSNSLLTRRRRRRRNAGAIKTPIPTPTLDPPSPSIPVKVFSDEHISFSTHVAHSSVESSDTSSMAPSSPEVIVTQSHSIESTLPTLIPSDGSSGESLPPFPFVGSSASSPPQSRHPPSEPDSSEETLFPSMDKPTVSEGSDKPSIESFLSQSGKQIPATEILEEDDSPPSLSASFSSKIGPLFSQFNLASMTESIGQRSSNSIVQDGLLLSQSVPEFVSNPSDVLTVSKTDTDSAEATGLFSTNEPDLQPSSSSRVHFSLSAIDTEPITEISTQPKGSVLNTYDLQQSEFEFDSMGIKEVGASSESVTVSQDDVHPSEQKWIAPSPSSVFHDPLGDSEYPHSESGQGSHTASVQDSELSSSYDVFSEQIVDQSLSSPPLDFLISSSQNVPESGMNTMSLPFDNGVLSTDVDGLAGSSSTDSDSGFIDENLKTTASSSSQISDHQDASLPGIDDVSSTITTEMDLIASASEYDGDDAIVPTGTTTTTTSLQMASIHTDPSPSVVVTDLDHTPTSLSPPTATTFYSSSSPSPAASTTETTSPPPATTTTTTSPRPTTTSTTTPAPPTTTMSSTTTLGPVNSRPVVMNPIGLIIAEQGRVLDIRVDRDVFEDDEDGNTESLTLDLKFPSGEKLPNSFWLYLVTDPSGGGKDGKSPSKRLKGLPLSQDMDMNINNQSVALVATDSQGLQATDSIVLQINVSPRTQSFTHKFILKFAIDFQKFIHKRQNLVDLISRISDHFGDASTHFITVLDVQKGSFILSWTNNTLAGPVCRRHELSQLLNRMVRKDGTVRPIFHRMVKRHLDLMEIRFEPLGPCIIPTTTTTTTTTILASSSTGTGLSIWAHVILPILIALVVFIFILYLIFMCNRHRKRQEALNVIEKDAFSNDRNPIIFPNEMDSDDAPLQPKSPLVLPSDTSTHVSSTDSPQHYQQSPQHYQQQEQHHPRHHQKNGKGKDREDCEDLEGDWAEASLKQKASSSSLSSSPSSSSSKGKNPKKNKDKSHKKSKSKDNVVGFTDPLSASSERPLNDTKANNCLDDDSNVIPDTPSSEGFPVTHSPTKRQPPPYSQASKHHPPPYRLPPPYGEDDDDDGNNEKGNGDVVNNESGEKVITPSNENPFLKASCTTTQV